MITYLLVLNAFVKRPSVAGPPPIITILTFFCEAWPIVGTSPLGLFLILLTKIYLFIDVDLVFILPLFESLIPFILGLV